MENTYSQLWAHPFSLTRHTFSQQSEINNPPTSHGYLRNLNDLKTTIDHYSSQQTPVYLRVSRQMGDSLTCDTYFGTFEEPMTRDIFRFYDIDNDIHRVIPADHLLMIKPTPLT